MRRAKSKKGWRAAAGTTIAALLLSATPAGAQGPGATMDLARAPVTLIGEASGDEAGFQVEIGDFDGDGRDDLVVGAWLNDGGGPDSGAVYIEYGPLSKSIRLADADVKLAPGAAGEYVGEGPLGVADFDGDGADDLFLGAPGSFYATQPGSPGKIGETFVVYGGKRLRGSLDLAEVAKARIVGIQMTEWLGFGVGSLGDLNGDDFEDVLIGAPATAGFTGAAYLFLGRGDRLEGDVSVTDADAALVGSRPGEMFGYESAGGDLDDDGEGDLFVASRPFVPGPSSVRTFFSAASLSGVVPALASDSELVAPTTDLFIGPDLFFGSDVTGDRVPDLIAGHPASLGFGAPAATYVIAGGQRPARGATLKDAAAATIDGAGDAVVAGLLDGDKFADVVVGATGQGQGGAALLFSGALTESISSDEASLVMNGEPVSYAGQSLAVGDLNADGKTDLAIGAPGNAGRVYVVFGPLGRRR